MHGVVEQKAFDDGAAARRPRPGEAEGGAANNEVASPSQELFSRESRRFNGPCLSRSGLRRCRSARLRLFASATSDNATDFPAFRTFHSMKVGPSEGGGGSVPFPRSPQ